MSLVNCQSSNTVICQRTGRRVAAQYLWPWLWKQKSERERWADAVWKEEGKGRPLQWGNTPLWSKSYFNHVTFSLLGEPPRRQRIKQSLWCFCQSCAWERFHPFVLCADGILSHRRGKQLKCLPGYFRGANVTPCLSWACCNTLFTCASDTHT